MRILQQVLPLSKEYDSPIFDAVGLQVVLGLLSLLILDGGETAQVCGVAVIAFWSGVAVLICRRPLSPSKFDLQAIRFGYLPIVIGASFLVHWIWHLRGLQ
jgi:hypothetical protein